ncbi:Uu.00g125300.m01.CDS01 [Anthostomella pinea]|uniref:Uu.00g125300.m01.CDS01 n=1 Tax=Anthostomella pinea TaxID=933095 RepID=A0AAI8VIA7_9PEZI|nr:Uu.00g125300.m01.CDS01 [Anthostomella pinea]
MSSSNNQKLPDFPDVEAKLQKPSRQSAFEKQKADAEAKRKREAAETAAVYESFVKSFDNDDDDDNGNMPGQRGGHQGANLGRPGGNGPAFGGGDPPKRHFGAGNAGLGLKSGPGSLPPAPPAFGKKKFDSFQQGFNRKGLDDGRGQLGPRDDDSERSQASRPKGIPKAFDTSDDETDTRSRDAAEEKATARPTLRLSNLPPVTSPAVIKALIPSTLTVENIKILPYNNTRGGERKSIAAIVTLSQETPAADIEAAVSSLQNRYLGYGFYLSLHRHLSSAVATTTIPTLSSSSTSQAFGAKPVPQANENNIYKPGGFHRGFAPPSSYGPGGGPMQRTILHVPVQPPKDIKQIQLIHKVVESVLEHGPEFEALLMSRPDVQREEKWAWLWDARSEGGVWYRWRLWEVITGAEANAVRQGKYLPLFDGSHAWKMPEKPLTYEYTTAIDEFVSDPEYSSSDEEDFEDEGNKPPEGGDNEKTYLNPFDKARMAHLLARLPMTLTKIRKGDIARITTFAITHSSRGADEIVDMIVSNIVKPLALTSANPEHKKGGSDEELGRGSQDATPLPEDVAAKTAEAQDTSGSSLVGLYVVSDILSSSATSGLRHAWRYRQLFETSLKQGKVFEILGLTAERLNWGRLRAEKWKRSIGLVLSLWEGWCAFPNESQQLFMQTFENPPSAKKEEQTEEVVKKAGKWKTVEAGSGVLGEEKAFLPVSTRTDAGDDNGEGGASMDDVDGEVMDEDADMMDMDLDSDIDGVPMDDDEEEGGVAMDQDQADNNNADETSHAEKPRASPPKESQQPRRRLRAVDMFADSDGSDNGR